MEILYAMSHIGYTIPPQADCGWIGEAGPGPSYGDVVEGSDVPVGYDNDFTLQELHDHVVEPDAHRTARSRTPAGCRPPGTWRSSGKRRQRLRPGPGAHRFYALALGRRFGASLRVPHGQDELPIDMPVEHAPGVVAVEGAGVGEHVPRVRLDAGHVVP